MLSKTVWNAIFTSNVWQYNFICFVLTVASLKAANPLSFLIFYWLNNFPYIQWLLDFLWMVSLHLLSTLPLDCPLLLNFKHLIILNLCLLKCDSTPNQLFLNRFSYGIFFIEKFWNFYKTKVIFLLFYILYWISFLLLAWMCSSLDFLANWLLTDWVIDWLDWLLNFLNCYF